MRTPEAGPASHGQRIDQAWVHYGIAFDAFDLPWKTQASGLAIEQYWGLYSGKREPFPALSAWQTLRARKEEILQPRKDTEFHGKRQRKTPSNFFRVIPCPSSSCIS